MLRYVGLHCVDDTVPLATPPGPVARVRVVSRKVTVEQVGAGLVVEIEAPVVEYG